MRHSVRARFLQTLACAGCALALPASALAGGSPVHVDPGSPVAKEYALPLATARGAPPESGQSGKLFGSGIKHPSTTTVHTTSQAPPPTPPSTYTQPSAPAVTETTPAVTATTKAGAPKPARHRPVHVTTVTLPSLTATTTTTPAKPATARATPAAYRVLRPGSGSGWLWMVLAAVIVVALGSAGGLALSRRR